MNEDTREDLELFRRWVKGDAEAFDRLYTKHKMHVYTFILRMAKEPELARDLMQETFLSALRHADQFDNKRSLMSWIFGIAHKKTIDYFRHLKITHDHRHNSQGANASVVNDQSDHVDRERIRKAINEAVESLDPIQREVFLLRETGGLAFKDIARILNCPLNTALGRMRLALKNLRIELQKRGVYGVQ